MNNLNINFNFSGVDTSYSTHSLHPYPAKFPPQLPQSILKQFAEEGQTVLDPFCGSGTTLVEAKTLNINAIGVDVNGLSVLLSKVKSTRLNEEQHTMIDSFVDKIQKQLVNWIGTLRPRITPKNIEGLRHWFQNNVAEELTFILTEIMVIKDENVKDFLKIVFSSIIVRVSNQDSDTRFAAIDKAIENGFTLNLFISRVSDYSKKVKTFSENSGNEATVKVFNADSRDLSFIEKESIDIIVTSPPYANTYDYYLYHKFRKRWLDLDVNFAQYNEIGSRRQFSSLKHNPEKWTNDLILCFQQMREVLKKEKLAFIVIGDSVINKEIIKIDEVINKFVIDVGFEIINIVSSDLAGHSRIFNPSFAQKGKKEHLITLKKI